MKVGKIVLATAPPRVQWGEDHEGSVPALASALRLAKIERASLLAEIEAVRGERNQLRAARTALAVGEQLIDRLVLWSTSGPSEFLRLLAGALHRWVMEAQAAVREKQGEP